MVLQEEACKTGKEVYGYFLFRHFLRDDLLFPAPLTYESCLPSTFQRTKEWPLSFGWLWQWTVNDAQAQSGPMMLCRQYTDS